MLLLILPVIISHVKPHGGKKVCDSDRVSHRSVDWTKDYCDTSQAVYQQNNSSECTSCSNEVSEFARSYSPMTSARC